MITVGIECSSCGTYFRYTIEKSSTIHCLGCNNEQGTIHPKWQYEEACPFCQYKGFYKRKDFNQLLGLIIIILGAVLAVMINYIFLLIFVLIDFLLLKVIPEVGICYHCSAEFRGLSDTQNLPGFSHHQSELYQE